METQEQLEKCCGCGWTGTESQKLHSGLSGLKGLGLCPDCEGEEFEEMKEKGVLEGLYASEINFSMDTFWDGGVDVTLGRRDEPVAKGNCRTPDEALAWLDEQARIHYPASAYATIE